MASSGTMNKIERAHQRYREGKYAEALGFYTDALSLAKTKSQKIALHSNRAACFLKLHDFKKAADECTLVLELDQKHTGALMLRAQTLVTLKEYHSALFDVNRLIELNPSSEMYQNLHARLKTQLVKLSKERDSLALAAKKLGRDLAKLETFKRQLVQSLSDDDSSQAETVDIGTYDQSVHKSYPVIEEVNGYTMHHSFSGSMDGRGSYDDASKQAVQRFSIPYITPRLTPTDTPKTTSASVSPRRFSAAVSPQRTSGSSTPTNPQFQGRGSMSSFYPSSQQSSAANSPPRARAKPAQTPRVDGKEFFRQARSRLSYEQFSAFLANIKELNAQKQSREETLKKAEEIFGTDNKDLYLSFQGMLNRGVH